MESVGALALSSGRRVSNYVRQIAVRLAIEGSDSRVIPDLTASADVLYAEQDQALLVPREAVYEEGGKSVVYVKQAESFTPREVALRLGVCRATVQRLIVDGTIPVLFLRAHRGRRLLRVREDALEGALLALEQPKAGGKRLLSYLRVAVCRAIEDDPKPLGSRQPV